MLTQIWDSWDSFFFSKQSTRGLSLFRLMIGLAIGLHVMPTFLAAPDVYFSQGFKTMNTGAYPDWLLLPVSHSTDLIVACIMALFLWSWSGFLIGYKTQFHCALLTFSCLYLEILNSFYLQTLAYDLLIATLVLLCFTRGTGDYFSIDGKSIEAEKKNRPVTITRLLQLQLSWVYFYSGITKIFPGNWFSDNPLYYLLNYPSEGSVRDFWMRDWLAQSPEICYALGISLVVVEAGLCILLWPRKTARVGVAAGILFHLTLFATIHIPNLFVTLFPATLLLFLPSKSIKS